MDEPKEAEVVREVKQAAAQSMRGLGLLLFGGFLLLIAVAGGLAFLLYRLDALERFFWLPLLLVLLGFASLMALMVLRALRGLQEFQRTMPSPERLAAMQATAPSPTPNVEPGKTWPTVPDPPPTPPAGEVLRYRPVPEQSHPGWLLLGFVVFALIWAGVEYVAFTRFPKSEFGGYGLLLFIPIVLGIGSTFPKAVAHWLAGAVQVECDDLLLRAGQTSRILVRRSGSSSLGQLRAALICEESVRFRPTFTLNNTNRNRPPELKTESKTVCEQDLLGKDNPENDGVSPRSFQVPAEAMHSFQAEHNQIIWKLVLSGRVLGWLPFQKAYTVVVLPAVKESKG